jgi:opacity protein-like surface antigen
MKKLNIAITTFIILIQLTVIFGQDIRSSTSGFSVGLHGKYANWMSTSNFVGSLDEEEPNGIGFGATIAYGMNENISFFLSYTQTNYAQNEDWIHYTHQLTSAGVRVNFGATLKMLRPYLQAGIAQHNMKVDPIILGDDIFNLYELKMTGIGVTFGTGIQLYLTPSLAVDISAQGNFGNFADVTLDGQDFNPETKTDFRFLAGQIGITYYLQ